MLDVSRLYIGHAYQHTTPRSQATCSWPTSISRRTPVHVLLVSSAFPGGSSGLPAC